jgi:hypothetical protein
VQKDEIFGWFGGRCGHGADTARIADTAGHKTLSKPAWILAKVWLPPRDSNPDMLIQSSIARVEGEEDKGLGSAKSSKVLQNPQQNSNKI